MKIRVWRGNRVPRTTTVRISPPLADDTSAPEPQMKKRRRELTEEEVDARRFVFLWSCHGREVVGDDEAGDAGRRRQCVAVELHAHSARSHGSLSPAELVERAHRNGVKVLALTDQDTMASVPEAMEAARQYPIRIIPGVEMSARHSPSDGTGAEEPVHILAYSGSWGPAKPQELERFLPSIRDGRCARANEMLLKLRDLDMLMKLEDVCKIAGHGVAPGRLHVARAMVEAGYVDNSRQAFSKYLYDGGPAYATEPTGESVVQLVCRTGGLSDLADTYELLKLGGADFHGRDDKEEPDVGSVDLPVLAVSKFLEVAQPIWHNAIKEIFASSIIERTTDLNGSKGFRRASSAGDFCILRLFSPELIH